MESILDEVGWVQDIIINEVTGNLLDGHLRIDLAIERRETLVPYKKVKLSPEEEDLILQTFDAIGSMARTNREKLDQLIADNSHYVEQLEEHSEAISERLENLNDYVNFVESSANVYSASLEDITEVEELEDDNTVEGNTEDRVTSALEVVEPKYFELNKTPYDIPPLIPSMLCDCPEPIETWVMPEINDGHQETHHFLVVLAKGFLQGMPWDKAILCTHAKDEDLETLWDNLPSYSRSLLSRKPYGAMTPEFSFGIMPKAERIFNIYRNRYVGRLWQELGIKVLPTMSYYANKGDENFLYAGIPKNLPCVSIQFQNVYSEGNEKMGKEDRGIAHLRINVEQIIKHLKPQSLIIYGGSLLDEAVEQLKIPKQLHLVPIKNWSHGKNAYRKALPKYDKA